ncbi:hypothetical protein NEIELOOT_00916 [Neisseria elongata subsp. glycolytica ATCC 29315]|uniref:Uncharacterized protein n=1 Tax=Neisseria elongata subsp. glycolytica ATCC 29315 TaxID=546263 RepID=D4DPC9_NEIEG|nr:hypothetical protein NEIELOOT_00916 [Neisseria elongata subsp. glycolytica ATCC 29315]
MVGLPDLGAGLCFGCAEAGVFRRPFPSCLLNRFFSLQDNA